MTDDYKAFPVTDLSDEVFEEFVAKRQAIKALLQGYHTGLSFSVLATIAAEAIMSVDKDRMVEAAQLFFKTVELNIVKNTREQ